MNSGDIQMLAFFVLVVGMVGMSDSGWVCGGILIVSAVVLFGIAAYMERNKQ